MSLAGSTLAGGMGIRERVMYDFYATPIPATLALLKRESFIGKILEPACGQGHIIKAVKTHNPESDIEGTDIIQRDDVFNLGIKGGIDFMRSFYEPGEYDHVITNPPFSLAQEFIEKSLKVASQKVAVFCKIQLLEGKGRKRLFDQSKLKTIYVFRGRINPLHNGKETDENGKPWSSTMCFAWFVWDNKFQGDPSIRWKVDRMNEIPLDKSYPRTPAEIFQAIDNQSVNRMTGESLIKQYGDRRIREAMAALQEKMGIELTEEVGQMLIHIGQLIDEFYKKAIELYPLLEKKDRK
jgi:hypothetical protein